MSKDIDTASAGIKADDISTTLKLPPSPKTPRRRRTRSKSTASNSQYKEAMTLFYNWCKAYKEIFVEPHDLEKKVNEVPRKKRKIRTFTLHLKLLLQFHGNLTTKIYTGKNLEELTEATCKIAEFCLKHYKEKGYLAYIIFWKSLLDFPTLKAREKLDALKDMKKTGFSMYKQNILRKVIDQTFQFYTLERFKFYSDQLNKPLPEIKTRFKPSYSRTLFSRPDRRKSTTKHDSWPPVGDSKRCEQLVPLRSLTSSSPKTARARSNTVETLPLVPTSPTKKLSKHQQPDSNKPSRRNIFPDHEQLLSIPKSNSHLYPTYNTMFTPRRSGINPCRFFSSDEAKRNPPSTAPHRLFTLRKKDFDPSGLQPKTKWEGLKTRSAR